MTTATTPTGLPNREADPNPDWRQGYGCSFWSARHGYRGDGAYGQYAIVLPEQDVALAITSEPSTCCPSSTVDHLLPAAGHAGRVGSRLPTPPLGPDGRAGVPAPSSSAPGPETGSWIRADDSHLPPAYAA